MSVHQERRLPRFVDLPAAPGAPVESAWGIFGPDDRLGTLNLLTSERVRAASALVRFGVVIPLDVEVDEIDPPLFGRPAVERVIHPLGSEGAARDEELRRFNVQTTTQWDGFGHVSDPLVGAYNGRRAEEHGVDAWASHGIVGRAVLADIAARRLVRGQSTDFWGREEIAVPELAATLAAESVALEEGDILLVRTGWLAFYRRLDQTDRHRLAADSRSPGLAPERATLEFLWDNHVAAVAADNPSLEAWPPVVTGSGRSLHRSLLARLGIPIGELFDLEQLGERCVRTKTYESFFVSVPLRIPGGVATTANAVAVL